MKIKELTDALSAQLDLLEELLALLERETPELAKIHLDAMAEINGLKEDVVARIEGHTAPLRHLIEEAAAGLGLPPNASLGEVAALVLHQGNKEIQRLQHELNRVAGQVQQVAATNREIAERFVSTVSNSLNFLVHIVNQSSVYGASGGYQRPQPGAVMINRKA
jgi:flagellar biosynthesis/type III secretory pathway chaperone